MPHTFSRVTRRLIFAWLALLATAGATALQAQEAYPSRPVKIVVPFAAGGAADLTTRMVATEMGKHLGTTVIVENKGGAAGNVGMDSVARSPKDGHTVVLVTNTASANPWLYKNIPFDIEKDFAPVGLICNYYSVLVVNANSPIKSVADLVAKAKRAPGTVTFGSSGVGGASYFAAVQFARAAGIQLSHVPYKGVGPAMQDVLGGHLDMLFDVVGGAEPFVKSGKARALAVTSRERLANLPNVPALSEVLPGLTQYGWLGLAVPAGTPPDRVRRLNAALSASLENRELRERMTAQGLESPRDVTPAGLTQQITHDLVLYRDLAAAMGIQPQ